MGDQPDDARALRLADQLDRLQREATRLQQELDEFHRELGRPTPRATSWLVRPLPPWVAPIVLPCLALIVVVAAVLGWIGDLGFDPSSAVRRTITFLTLGIAGAMSLWMELVAARRRPETGGAVRACAAALTVIAGVAGAYGALDVPWPVMVLFGSAPVVALIAYLVSLRRRPPPGP